MTEEEKGAVQGPSLEELGQKVDALEGYMREYRGAKQSNKVVKIVIVVLIVAVVLIYAGLFLRDILRLYGGAKRITEDTQFQQEIIQALGQQLELMQPQLRAKLRESWDRIGPEFREELDAARKEYGAEIEEALQRETEDLYAEIKDELQPHLNAAATEVLKQIVDEELAAIYDNIRTTLLEELRSAGSRLIPRLRESMDKEALLLSENLEAELMLRLNQEFAGLLRYYYDLLEEKFPEITDETTVARMAANVQVAFEEAAKDIISERLKDHQEALLDISDTLTGFKVDEKATDEELWRKVKESLSELLQIKLATEVIKAEEAEE